MAAAEAAAAVGKQQQKGGGGRGGGGGGPAPFLTKTHQMVEESATDEVISWGKEGRSFVVWKPVEFARDLLPLHFKHCNFSSFVRQLNTYGFRKVVPDRWEFANGNFRRGEQGLLSGIRRRKATTRQSSKSCGSGVNVAFPPPLPPLPPAPSATTSSGNDCSSSSASSPPRADITSENEQLRKDNQTLTTELARARRHCEELLGFLSRFLDVRQLDLRLLMQEDMRAAAAGGGEQREQEHAREEKCVKLFGVLLDDTHGAATRKRARCEEAAASERPIKMIRIGEPWVSVPSSGPARCGGDN
uniref:HSF-type DNA-binding domain-containing protein n=1 Tax=Oryza meridionalis TaxID=40149 RepID=A0A0E0ESY9_9ORYZ